MLGSDTVIRRRTGWWSVLAAALLLGVAVALPAVASSFVVGLVSLWLPLVLLAIAVDLLWGENRIVSFGHGAFFAAGGYVAGLVLKGPQGDTSGTNLAILGEETEPSRLDTFVEALGKPEIVGIPVLGLIMPVLVCAIVGVVVGAAVFRVGEPELYAPLITLGVGVVATTLFLKSSTIGGSNGLSGIPRFVERLAADPVTATYLFNLAVVAVALAGYALVRRSRLGRYWRSCGDDPIRMASLGAPVAAVRAAGFAVSAALAGLAGALYAATAGFMSPGMAGVAFSVQALIWVAVGGSGYLWGPLIGVLAVQAGQYGLGERMDHGWQLVLGIALLVVVQVAPKGLAGVTVRQRKENT